MPMDSSHRVVVLGGGFGGLAAAKKLGGAPVQVMLIDRRNFHLFQPLLYQVATGVSPGDIAWPLRRILRRQRNVRVIMAEVVDVDVQGRRVILSRGEIPYDTLVVSAGASPPHHSITWTRGLWRPSGATTPLPCSDGCISTESWPGYHGSSCTCSTWWACKAASWWPSSGPSTTSLTIATQG